MPKGPIFFTATIFALALVAAAVVISRFSLETTQKKSITVKGFAKAGVRSDIGVMHCAVAVRHAQRREALRALSQHKTSVLSYLSDAQTPSEGIAIGVPTINEVYVRDSNGKTTNQIEFYDARVTIAVTGSDVEQIRSIARGVADLAVDGVYVTVSEPEFLIANPDDKKLELIAAATRNARQRAQALANDGGGKVGRLTAARQGVFQITRPNSTATSSYGIYDTSTIQKEMKAVVTLEYEVDQ